MCIGSSAGRDGSSFIDCRYKLFVSPQLFAGNCKKTGVSCIFHHAAIRLPLVMSSLGLVRACMMILLRGVRAETCFEAPSRGWSGITWRIDSQVQTLEFEAKGCAVSVWVHNAENHVEGWDCGDCNCGESVAAGSRRTVSCYKYGTYLTIHTHSWSECPVGDSKRAKVCNVRSDGQLIEYDAPMLGSTIIVTTETTTRYRPPCPSRRDPENDDYRFVPTLRNQGEYYARCCCAFLLTILTSSPLPEGSKYLIIIIYSPEY